MDLLSRDVAHAIGNLFEAGDLEALAGLDSLDEGCSLQQGVVRAGIEPGVAAAHGLDVELVAREVSLIDVGDLELAARAGLEVFGDVDDAVVVEVEAGDGVAALGLDGLLFEADGAAVLVEFDDAVALGIVHRVGEDGGAVAAGAGGAQAAGEVVAVEEVVAEHEGAGAVADEVFADDEGLGEAVGAGLDGVLQREAPLAAVAQQLLKAWRVLRGADDEDVADARQHEGAERVVDHGLVVHRQQLLADGQGGRVQARARAAGQDDAFALGGGWGHGASPQGASPSVQGARGAAVRMGLQDFGQHALDTGLPVRQGQAEGGLQLGSIQARVVRAHGGRGEGAGGHRHNFICYYFNSRLRLTGMVI
mgnify:CR=1 FL=1